MRIRGRDLYAAGWLVDSGENSVTWIKERAAAGDLLGVSLGTETRVFEYAANVAVLTAESMMVPSWLPAKLRSKS